MANTQLIEAIRARLQEAADPSRAAGAQAYMKSEMPSLGVRVPEVRRIVKAAAAELPPAGVEELRSTVVALWRGAACREEQYAALDLTGLRMAAREPSMLAVYEEIICNGAWWDLVDGVAHRLGALLQAHREELTPVLRRWSTDKNIVDPAGFHHGPARGQVRHGRRPAGGRHRSKPGRFRVRYPEGHRVGFA